MLNTNEKIDGHLRQNFLRRVIIIVIIATLFVGFMGFALYKEYGPGSEMVDYYPEVNREEKNK